MSPGGRPLAHGVVGFGQQLQRAMSQADAAFNVTGEAADSRADDGYPAEDSPGFLDRRLIFQTPFGVVQAGFGFVGAVGEHVSEGANRAKYRTFAYQLRRQLIKPGQHGLHLLIKNQRHASRLDQADGSIQIIASDRVLHRVAEQSVSLVPGTSPAMQL